MNKKSKVTKFKKRRSINVGHIIFLIIFIYISISFYIYLTKDHLTIYEVRKGSIAKENIYNGLILRDEEVYNTDMAGYIYYYYKDGDRIANNTVVYTINEDKNTTSLVDTDLNSSKLNSKETAKIGKEITNFRENYNNNEFEIVYDFKYNLNNVAIEIMNEQNQDALGEYSSLGDGDYFQAINSEASGIITYFVDNYEKLTWENINHEHFSKNNYDKKLLRQDEIYDKGTPAYKLVTDNTWDIIIEIDQEVYNYLSKYEDEEIHDVTIRFIDEDILSPGSFTYFKNNEGYFGRITLDYYMEKFVNQRFVDIELNIDKKTGLKVPTSAIVDKEFYLVPHKFFTKGGDSDSTGLILESYDEENELILTFVPTEVYYQDEENCYINTLVFEPNSWIRSESEERLKLNEKGTLKGVYNVNKGYGVFRQIELIEEGEEYSIVKEETPYGLSVFDQIALVGDTTIEENIIY